MAKFENFIAKKKSFKKCKVEFGCLFLEMRVLRRSRRLQARSFLMGQTETIRPSKTQS